MLCLAKSAQLEALLCTEAESESTPGLLLCVGIWAFEETSISTLHHWPSLTNFSACMTFLHLYSCTATTRRNRWCKCFLSQAMVGNRKWLSVSPACTAPDNDWCSVTLLDDNQRLVAISGPLCSFYIQF